MPKFKGSRMGAPCGSKIFYEFQTSVQYCGTNNDQSSLLIQQMYMMIRSTDIS